MTYLVMQPGEGITEITAPSLSYDERIGFYAPHEPMSQVDMPDPNTVKTTLLAAGSVIGGGIIGYGIASSYREGNWIEEVTDGRELDGFEAAVAFSFANVSLVFFGKAMLEAFEEFGAAKMIGFSVAVPAIGYFIRALRD